MRWGPLSVGAKSKNGASARLTRETLTKLNDPCKKFCGLYNPSMGVVIFVQ